jgi:RND superfamily putative drug exporter
VRAFTEWVIERPRTVIAAWIILLAAAAHFSMQADRSIGGTTDGIPGSLSDEAIQAVNRAFGPYSGFVFPLVIQSAEVRAQDPRFQAAVARVEEALTATGNAQAVHHFWNSGAKELLGKDGRSALVLVTPKAETFNQAESLVPRVRDTIRAADIDSLFEVKLTGSVAVFHDVSRHSAEDLVTAERVGIPITLVILLVVFGAPLAAGVPLLLAVTAAVVTLAMLFALSPWMPMSIFAQNAVTMIGLGVGVDYALLLLRRFYDELAVGRARREAVIRAAMLTGRTVVVSGLTVAVGFLVLLLVHVPLIHSLAIGGAAVVGVAVAATLTLLPALLQLAGDNIFWPFRPDMRRARPGGVAGIWAAWAQYVMRRPWQALVPAVVVMALFIVPVFSIAPWNPGAKDLPLQFESRQGAEILGKSFSRGWLGPVVLAVEVEGKGSMWDISRQDAVLAMVERIAGDGRVAAIGGFAAVLDAMGPLRREIRSLADVPPQGQSLAAQAVSESGTMALVVLIPKEAPESREVMSLVDDLRRDNWSEARAAGFSVRVAGASAAWADFDHELFSSLRRVVPTVLVATFLMLLVMFRSILIPLKAMLLNLAAVLASWGFLVLVFQDGIGAELIGLEPPGGLNAFIVLMLFTILFGLSMDYEVFLLGRIKEERDAGCDNATAVARGLQHTAGTITSAALVMICIFGSFAFTTLTATREFGLGLAFAVALDATLIRLVLVPVLMKLLGEWNWWLPLRRCNTGILYEQTTPSALADAALPFHPAGKDPR